MEANFPEGGRLNPKEVPEGQGTEEVYSVGIVEYAGEYS